VMQGSHWQVWEVLSLLKLLYTGEVDDGISPEQAEGPHRQKVFLGVLTIVAIVVFLVCVVNLFIAVLSDSYQMEQEKMVFTLLRERSHVSCGLFLGPRAGRHSIEQLLSRGFSERAVYATPTALCLAFMLLWSVLIYFTLQEDIPVAVAAFTATIGIFSFQSLVRGWLTADFHRTNHLWICHDKYFEAEKFMVLDERDTMESQGRIARLRNYIHEQVKVVGLSVRNSRKVLLKRHKEQDSCLQDQAQFLQYLHRDVAALCRELCPNVALSATPGLGRTMSRTSSDRAGSKGGKLWGKLPSVRELAQQDPCGEVPVDGPRAATVMSGECDALCDEHPVFTTLSASGPASAAATMPVASNLSAADTLEAAKLLGLGWPLAPEALAALSLLGGELQRLRGELDGLRAELAQQRAEREEAQRAAHAAAEARKAAQEALGLLTAELPRLREELRDLCKDVAQQRADGAEARRAVAKLHECFMCLWRAAEERLGRCMEPVCVGVAGDACSDGRGDACSDARITANSEGCEGARGSGCCTARSEARSCAVGSAHSYAVGDAHSSARAGGSAARDGASVCVDAHGDATPAAASSARGNAPGDAHGCVHHNACSVASGGGRNDVRGNLRCNGRSAACDVQGDAGSDASVGTVSSTRSSAQGDPPGAAQGGTRGGGVYHHAPSNSEGDARRDAGVACGIGSLLGHSTLPGTACGNAGSAALGGAQGGVRLGRTLEAVPGQEEQTDEEDLLE